MTTDTLREIPGPAGTLEAILDMPAAAPRAACVLGHPHPQYGGTLHTKALYRTAKALTHIGVAALRINFRGVGRSAGGFDAGVGEQADFRAALDFAADRFPGLPLWAGGMSFGAWIAMAAGADDPRVSLLLGIAAPVDRYDFEGVKASAKPTFLVHGEEDELVSIRQVRKFYGELAEPKDLAVLEGADHLFDGQTLLVGEIVEGLLRDVDAGHAADSTQAAPDAAAGIRTLDRAP